MDPLIFYFGIKYDVETSLMHTRKAICRHSKRRATLAMAFAAHHSRFAGPTAFQKYALYPFSDYMEAELISPEIILGVKDHLAFLAVMML